MDTKKQSVTSQIAAMNAATASVVQLTGGKHLCQNTYVQGIVELVILRH